MFYNGITQHDVEDTSKIGTDAWQLGQGTESVVPVCSFKSVGELTPLAAERGVLIDIWSHLNKSYDPFATPLIKFVKTNDCAKAQGVELQHGDILMTRSGRVDAYVRMRQAKRTALAHVQNYAHNFVGVEQTVAAVDFLQHNHFTAVAGDQLGFEVWPPGLELTRDHPTVVGDATWRDVGTGGAVRSLQAEEAVKQYTFFFVSTL